MREIDESGVRYDQTHGRMKNSKKVWGAGIIGDINPNEIRQCGIAGAGGGDRPQDEKEGRRMGEKIAHRGPDMKTCIMSKDGKWILVQTRLSIVDAENPETIKMMKFENNERECILTFNGEIYNYSSLREDLKKKGYIFETNSDTEVLLKFLTEYGKAGIEKLDGQFAFAFRDSNTEQMLMARDRTGKKPLYYSLVEESFNDYIKRKTKKEVSPEKKLRFASEPSALVNEVGFRPDMESIVSLLLNSTVFAAGEEPSGKSIYKDILQLKPGEVMTYNEQDKVYTKEIYAIPPIEDIKEIKSESEYINDMRLAVELAIRKRVPNEVKVGAALSGGLDSSIVTLITADQMKRQSSKREKLIAASIFYTKQSRNSDYEHAEIVARRAGNIELIKTEISPENFLDNLEEMVSVLGIHDSIRQLAMFANYKNLKEHGVKVAMIGEGADEFNWGYWHKFPGLKEGRESCSSAEKLKGLVLKRKNYVETLLNENVLKNININDQANYLVDIYNSFKTMDPTRKMMGLYVVVFLDFLNKANDRCSMVNAIEARAPFQDNDLIKVCLNTPMEMQIKDGTEKYILRESFKAILPVEVYQRRKEPLPAASHIDYHKKISSEFRKWLESADNNFWQFFNKDTWFKIADSYENKINELEREYADPEEAGAELMAWRGTSEDVDIVNGKGIRTNDVFKLLTTLIWFKQNEEYLKQ